MFERSMEWWLWLATVVLLTVGLVGDRTGLLAAIFLAGAQVPLIAQLRGGIISFPSQVRISYLILLVLGMYGPLAFLHWIQFVGTWAMVLTEYCFLARCLSLLPINRNRPLTGRDIIRTFVCPPVKGNVLHGLPPESV